jgi:tRNA nucleotidyltransferase/poly(A) polymerase
MSCEQALDISRTLRAAGYCALFNGGCVRDHLLGKTPHDYDIATDARPEQVTALFPNALQIGAHFGVVFIPEEGEHGVEVATFRADGDYRDGRRPESVTYANDPATDARRRDFTINGMFLDPETGALHDFVGGQQDLRDGVIRAIGDPERRFAEDKLRLLRAVRFAARLDFRIDETTEQAIRAHHREIKEVSQERVRDELTKMLTEGRARRAFELLESTGLLQETLPEMAETRGVAQPPQFHPEGDVWIHTLLMIEGLPAGASSTLAWGVLLHDVGKPPTFQPPQHAGDRIRFNNHAAVGARMSEAICERLRFSRRDTERVVSLVDNHLRFIDVPKMRNSTLKRFLRMDGFEEHLELHRLDCESSHRDLRAYHLVREKLGELTQEQVSPPPLITGDDLIAMGYAPGPSFREILHAVEDAQLEGEVHTTSEARAWVRGHYRNP